MHWLINQDLSCCDVDGHLVFLDFALDRYFTLTAPLESVMRHYLTSGALSPCQREELEGKGIVIATSPAPGVVPAELPDPTASAIELSGAAHRPVGAGVLAEVAATVWWTRRQLRRRPFKAVIRDALARRACIPPHTSPARVNEALRDAAAQFTHARRYVPVDPCCLPDSLALFHFLSRRRLPARIVFGVTLVPFAAHCWVQTEGTVLNETLSDAVAHTPIRII